MSVRAPVGPINFTNQHVCIGRGLAAIRATEKVESKFVYFWLLFKQREIKGNEGAVFASINKRQIESIDLPLPPLPAQKRIVAILDEVFAGIDTALANTDKNLANARELFESYLNAVFGRTGQDWVQVSIGDIAQVKGGKRVPKGHKLQKEETSHPYVSVADFNERGSVDLSGIKYLDNEVYQQINRYTISSSDLYISIAGTIGKTGIVPPELDGANLTENACKLVFKDGVFNRFIYFFTRTKLFREQALKNTRTTAQPKLALARLRTIRLGLPSLEEQYALVQQFDEFWSQAADLESIYRQKLTALAELKQSLLQKAFSGELTANTVEAKDTAEPALA